MENKSNKKRIVSKRVSACLIAALFIVGVMGFYAFAPYPGENANGKIDGLAKTLANWKTYSNKYLTFKYPDTYKITDEEESEDSYDLCCEIKGDDISMVQLSVTELDDVEDLDEETKELVMTIGVGAMKEELEGNSYYKGFSSTKVKKITRGHNTGYGFTFTATILAVPVQGECFMAVSGKRLLTYVSQAENAKYMSQLNEIVSGIRVK